MIKEITVGERRYGIIEGATHSIITETDCCHVVEPNDATVQLASSFGWQPAYDAVAVKDLLAQAQSVESLTKWIHYFGIKPRVYSNYQDLLRSMKEIGVDISKMPKWERSRVA